MQLVPDLEALRGQVLADGVDHERPVADHDLDAAVVAVMGALVDANPDLVGGRLLHQPHHGQHELFQLARASLREEVRCCPTEQLPRERLHGFDLIGVDALRYGFDDLVKAGKAVFDLRFRLHFACICLHAGQPAIVTLMPTRRHRYRTLARTRNRPQYIQLRTNCETPREVAKRHPGRAAVRDHPHPRHPAARIRPETGVRTGAENGARNFDDR